jgi:hypothetical protein
MLNDGCTVRQVVSASEESPQLKHSLMAWLVLACEVVAAVEVGLRNNWVCREQLVIVGWLEELDAGFP